MVRMTEISQKVRALERLMKDNDANVIGYRVLEASSKKG